MAGARKQQKRINIQPRTPKKHRLPERPVIGSSSTWKEEQLYRFKVHQGVAEAKTLVPEKWFKFGKMERYQRGIGALCNLVNYSS
jgi:hypothetical protein